MPTPALVPSTPAEAVSGSVLQRPGRHLAARPRMVPAESPFLTTLRLGVEGRGWRASKRTIAAVCFSRGTR
jgi:hypothetical protein